MGDSVPSGAEYQSGWLAAATLFMVLFLVAWGRFRLELIALSGIFFLGVTGTVPHALLLSGFSHPALVTMAAVFVMSRAIVDSGLLAGLGLALAHRVHTPHGQILSLALVTAMLSAFMNNVGALGLILPTGLRMARRLSLSPGTFGMPLAFASIIGGSMTMVGTGPNLLIANLRGTELGEPFGMFDFLPIGLPLLLTATVLWIICKSCGIVGEEQGPPPSDPIETNSVASRATSTWKRGITLAVVLFAIVSVSSGWLSSAWGFGSAALLLVLLNVTSIEAAHESLDVPILLFIGAMIGLANALSSSAVFEKLQYWVMPLVSVLPPLSVIAILLFLSSALANSTNNAAAAVAMAPVALMIAGQTPGVSQDASLMAVAIGAGLSIVLPTHQVTLLAKSRAPFDQHRFMRVGLVMTIVLGVVASSLIYMLF